MGRFRQLSTDRSDRNAKKSLLTLYRAISKRNPLLFNYKYHTKCSPNIKVVTYHNLHISDPMYQRIQNMIVNRNIVIENIVQVDNPLLKQAYGLKEVQKRTEFGEVQELLLFHGTSRRNIESICTYNFDWRLFGSNRGHKYGKGVSFSNNAMYASNYSDQDDYHKVMIVATVLVGKVCQGHEQMTYPPSGYDTSQKGNDGIVIVKYEDNEFYPAYKLYYHFDNESEYDYYDDYYTNYHYYDDYYFSYYGNYHYYY